MGECSCQGAACIGEHVEHAFQFGLESNDAVFGQVSVEISHWHLFCVVCIRHSTIAAEDDHLVVGMVSFMKDDGKILLLFHYILVYFRGNEITL